MQLYKRKSDRSTFEIVVTSMLDINFLLIMFFMMTAHFQKETHATLDLPKEAGEKQPQTDEAGLVINITASGEIIISGELVDMEELRRRVQEQRDRHAAEDSNSGGGPLKLMVRVDRNARSDHLNRIVTMLREENVGVIRIATEIPI